ncbi:MAG: hypothetical protein JWO03_2941 [Bacteroidetes bacterium]|nr:hypothetical protein [Bacteroidota bacterium]
MKKLITLVSIVFSLGSLQAQNVGIGNNSPGTKLDVSGAITHRETSVAIAANAATIPSNVSQVQLTGAASATITVTAPAAPPNAGQVLVIFNNTTGGFSASYGSTTIPNGVALEFIYSNSAWVPTSGAASGSGSYIQNRTTQQPSSDFNISNTGTIGTTLTVGTSTTSPTVQGSTAVSGTLTLKATSSATKPAAGILMNDNIASTSTTTGTAVITGGAGISGSAYVGATVNAASSGGGSASAFIGNAASPSYAWDANTQAADQKWWDMVTSGTTLLGRAVNDANSAANNWLQVNRGAGATVGSVVFPVNNVSVNTTSVLNNLTVNNGATTTANTTNSYALGVARSGSVDYTIGSDASFAYDQSWNSKPLLINSQGNNVGIGLTTTPTAQLHTTGTVRFANYPSGLYAADATGTLTAPRTITGTSNQIDLTNGNGVSGNPTININTAYSAALKSPFALTGGGTFSYISSNFAWSNRFIVISNGNGAQFSTSGYFDITMPTSGTITGVGAAANVTATASGIPMAGWQALYYILPIGSNNASVAANFRVASFTSALTVPENWILIAIVNGDDNTLRTGSGTIIQPGQTWTAGVGIAQNSGSGNYIQNGTGAQSASYNVTGSGTIGGTVKLSSYANGFHVGDGSGTLTTPRSIAISGTGITVTNGNGVSGNPTLNLNYGNSPASASGGGGFPVGNFGQFEAHGTYTDFNTTPAYWGWNYVQNTTNGPSTVSSQWYREITSLGSNYAGRGAGSYSLELAYPRFSAAAAGMWMRVNEGGTYSSWVRMDANGISAVSSSMHPSMDDITGWTTVLSSCTDDGTYTINWGFPIVIDGASYTSGWISTNGVLGFGSGASTVYTNTSIPTSISNDPMLFFHWDDDGADLIRYVVQGTAPNRNCFIQWQGSEATTCTGGASRVMAYITLSEGSNVVSVRYLAQGSNADAQGANATFGFQYSGGSSARTVPMGYNTKLLDDNASNQHFSIDLQ